MNTTNGREEEIIIIYKNNTQKRGYNIWQKDVTLVWLTDKRTSVISGKKC